MKYNSGLQILKNITRPSLVKFFRQYNKDHDLAVFVNDYVGRMVITYGCYESEELELVPAVMHQLTGGDSYRDGVCLDIGANVGNHSFSYSKLFRKVVSFEPNPIAYKLFEASILKNGVHNIELMKVAVGMENRMQRLSVYKVNLGGGSLCAGNDKRDISFDVAVRNGDEIIDEVLNTSDHISLIKVDVEGFETEVLNGLRDTIKKHSPVIVIELNFKTNRDESNMAVEILRNFGCTGFYTLGRNKVFKDKYLDLIWRLFFGERLHLIRLDEFDKDYNYRQVYSLVGGR